MKLETNREKQLDAYLQQASAKDEQILRLVLKGKPERLQVYRVPIKYLIFNIRNGRFTAELLQKESELKRRLDAAVPADEKIIQRILLELDKNATEALKKDLNANGQLDPGVITRDGAVVNANRRMAILSLLHEETHDPKFEYLRVARLPKDVDEKDIWRIEAGLQFAKEFRLDYSPVNELLKLKEGRESGLSPEEISVTLLGRFTAAGVRERLEVLKLIESYLEFIGKPGQYHIVQEQRSMEKFNSLQANVIAPLKKHGALKQSEIAKLSVLAFMLIHKTDLSHWDIRLLNKIGEDSMARAELYRNYDATRPLSEPKSRLEENFATAREVIEAQQNKNKPERLLRKALSALQGIGNDHEALAEASLKSLLNQIKGEVDRLLGVKARTR
ncbi:MAG TPA: hypothetical protein VMJ93_08710 [Verrucomicrobiae bacterium]|nr:hypothetical protein [Verrucomicrobiae bacterium]